MKEKAVKKYKLDIGRCEDMWGARSLLQQQASTQSEVSVQSIKNGIM